MMDRQYAGIPHRTAATKIDTYASIAPQVSTIPTLQNTPPTSLNSSNNQKIKIIIKCLNTAKNFKYPRNIAATSGCQLAVPKYTLL